MRITFLGAAREVTGSCYLVETQRVSFLVDCGMFQGADAGERNRSALPSDLSRVAFVLLTHAHIDHSGLLPAAGATMEL
jgi:metallo-beta-lactamase family protein